MNTRKPTNVLALSLDLIFQQRVGLVSACMRSVVLAPLPLLFQFIIDRGVPANDILAIAGAAFLSLGLLLMHYAFAVYGTKCLGAAVATEVAELRSRIFQKIQLISFGYLDTSASGKLISKYAFDRQRLQDGLLLILAQLIPNCLYSVLITVVMFIVDWRLSLVMLVLIPLMYVSKEKFGKQLKSKNAEARQAQENLSGKAGELINSLRMVRSLGGEENANQRVAGDNSYAAITRFRLMTIGAHFGTFMHVSSQIINLVIIAGGAYMVIKGGLTMGVLVAFVAALPQILMPIHLFTQFTEQFAASNESYRSIRELLETPFVEKWSGFTRKEEFEGRVELKGITFAYPSKPENVILKNFDLTVRPRENVA